MVGRRGCHTGALFHVGLHVWDELGRGEFFHEFGVSVVVVILWSWGIRTGGKGGKEGKEYKEYKGGMGGVGRCWKAAVDSR